MTKQFEGYWEDLDIPEDWECESYHNDAAPSWSSGICHIFVDHPDDSEREMQGDHRFFIFHKYDTTEFLDSDNDWNIILNVVKSINLIKERRINVLL